MEIDGDEITTPQKSLKDKRKMKEKRIKGFKSKIPKTRRQIRLKKMQNLKQEKVETNKKGQMRRENSTARVRG